MVPRKGRPSTNSGEELGCLPLRKVEKIVGPQEESGGRWLGMRTAIVNSFLSVTSFSRLLGWGEDFNHVTAEELGCSECPPGGGILCRPGNPLGRQAIKLLEGGKRL